MQTVDLSSVFLQIFDVLKHFLGQILDYLRHVIILPGLSALDVILILICIGIVLDIFVVVFPVVIDNDDD